ncbi:hypothetical protein BIV25_21590 [Streptomyces sp. MUSC 14]|uniref:undecaprenyl-diphosphate phosphatase n=1 Tax=Streptomyces sp. MUSC 14 TaxID=1354889 RepID=UPI0008F55CD8|nr:undecaprenyl-diphosphate phosphatase [Streptomyces sp. MUSC 14]OIJ94676.1 hypothetical protein BIV25_21590 [Streptomyces sp. MUSC 14]
MGVGLLQGVTELFPVSSLGHSSILIPALLGGHRKHDLGVSVRGLGTSISSRRIGTVDQRLAWLIVTAGIPVAVAGVVLDQVFRTTLGKPVPTAIFLASTASSSSSPSS